MGNETAGDSLSHDNVPSIIQQVQPQWPSQQKASALKRVGFVKGFNKLCHRRDPCAEQASRASRVSRRRGKLSLSHGIVDPMRQLEMQSNRMYKIPAAGARLIGSLPYLMPSIAISSYFWMHTDKASSINVGVIEREEDSAGTQTSDEARPETRRYFHRPPDLSWVYLSQVFFCSSRCSFIICQSSSFSFRSL